LARASASMLANDVVSSAFVFSSRLAVILLNDVVRYPISSAGPPGARWLRSTPATIFMELTSFSNGCEMPRASSPPTTRTTSAVPTNFSMQLFRLTPDYAGLTVSVDLWDPGDIASTSGFVRININDPSGNNVFPGGVNVYNLGVQRSNLASGNYTVLASAANGNTAASFVAQDTSRGISANSEWIHVEIPVPGNYNPAPGADWWSMQYVTGSGTIAVDTVTV